MLHEIFFLSLPTDLTKRDDFPTLEEINENAGKWHVILSYITRPASEQSLNEFATSTSGAQDKFREFIVDGLSGKVDMRNPANAMTIPQWMGQKSNFTH